MLTVDEARAGILALLPASLPAEDVELAAAAGRVLVDTPPGASGALVGGSVVGAWDLPRLAERGVSVLRCLRRPRVAIVANGNELVDVETAPGPGQVVDIATPALAAALRTLGAEPVAVPRAVDEATDIRRALREAAVADLVVSVAGVSVGEHDLVRDVVTELGEITSWRVAMRPGKPLAVGRVLDTPFIGLPGNPVSALVGFEVFVLPAVMALAGKPGWGRPVVAAELAEALGKPAGLRTYARATLEARGGRPPLARPVHGQGSFQLRWLANSDVLLDLPEAGERVEAGSGVRAILLDRAPVEAAAVAASP